MTQTNILETFKRFGWVPPSTNPNSKVNAQATIKPCVKADNGKH